MAITLNPTLTGRGRVFINVNGSGCGKPYVYHNCMRVESLEKSLGDITPIYCPSNDKYDSFIEVASIKGADSRWTSSVSGTLPVDEISLLEDVLRRGCPFNMQVHYGLCDRPDEFSKYDSAFILQDVRLTSYSLDSLVALSPDERAAVSETGAVSVGSVYRVLPLEYVSVAGGITEQTTGTTVGITICDQITCGTECETVGSSDGCQKIYALRHHDNGEFTMVFSVDGGTTWEERVIDNLVADNVIADNELDRFDIECIGGDLWVATYREDNDESAISIIPIDGVEFTTNNFVATTVFTTPSPAGITDLQLGEQYVYAVGEGLAGSSYVVIIDKTTGEATTLDDGDLILNFRIYTAVDAIDDNIVLIGGTLGTLVFSSIQGAYELIPINLDGVVVGNDIFDVHMIDDANWLISMDNNAANHTPGIACTSDRGVSWTFTQATSTGGKFSFYDDIVGYFQDDVGIYKTIDSGNTWTLVSSLPEQEVTGVVTCPDNPNVFYSTSGLLATQTSAIIKGGLA